MALGVHSNDRLKYECLEQDISMRIRLLSLCQSSTVEMVKCVAVCSLGPKELKRTDGAGRSQQRWLPMRQNGLGYLPLHLAVLHRAHWRVVDRLLEQYPAAAQETCDLDTRLDGRPVIRGGWLPLHAALEVGCGPEIVQRLTEAFPGATERSRSHYLPSGTAPMA